MNSQWSYIDIQFVACPTTAATTTAAAATAKNSNNFDVHTHYPNKEIAEDKWSYANPDEDVQESHCWVAYHDHILVDVVPLVQREELKECQHGLWNGAV